MNKFQLITVLFLFTTAAKAQLASLPPADYSEKQWGIHLDHSLEKTWELTKGENILVAVIDTGVDFSHPDLQSIAWVNKNEIPGNKIDDDNNGYIDDIHGINLIDRSNQNGFADHATHVAGIVAATHNDFGVNGVAPNVKIMSIKVCGSTSCDKTVYAEAVLYAKKMGAQVVNMSFGGGTIVDNFYQAIKDSPEIVFVAAAGNNYNSDKRYPGSYDLNNIISVASMDADITKSDFSSFGKENVDIFAPGGNIVSTTPENSYEYMDGTSMAAPYVTGVVALVLSYNGPQSISTMRERIIETSKRIQSLSGYVYSNGLVDPYNAVLGQLSFDYAWAK